MEDTPSLTCVKSATSNSGRVHIGYDLGSYDTRPLCPALADRECETTDEAANCPDCKKICRADRNLADQAEGLFSVWRAIEDW